MKRLVLYILALITSAGLVAGVASAQESRLKNIKVLTGMSDADIQRQMQTWSKALGTNCVYCHQQGDFASDENPKKEIARKMAAMVKAMNTDFFAGEAKINCVLCHRGATVPEPGN